MTGGKLGLQLHRFGRAHQECGDEEEAGEHDLLFVCLVGFIPVEGAVHVTKLAFGRRGLWWRRAECEDLCVGRRVAGCNHARDEFATFCELACAHS